MQDGQANFRWRVTESFLNDNDLRGYVNRTLELKWKGKSKFQSINLTLLQITLTKFHIYHKKK